MARTQPTWSAEAIAARVGCHPSTVRRHLQEQRVRPRRSTTTLSVEQKAATASAPATDARLLARLTRDSDRSIRVAVARHSKTPPRLLGRLARDTDRRVRDAVAEHLYTPPEALTRLSHAADRDVRALVAENTSARPGLLARLRGDRDSSVRWSALTNPSCPAGAVERAAASGGYMAQAAAARHPNCPQQLAERLAAHSDLHLRTAAAVNLAHRRDDIKALQAALDSAIAQTVAELRQEPAWIKMLVEPPDPDEADAETVEEIVDLANGALNSEQLFEDTAYAWREEALRDELAQAAVDAFYADAAAARQAAVQQTSGE